jgi:Ca2+-binding RTX toxin-like protein
LRLSAEGGLTSFVVSLVAGRLAGRDCLFGGSGIDRLAGGPGRDRLLGGRGRDRIAAGPGNDRVRARGQARDTVDCGPGQNDVATVEGLDQTRRCEQIRMPQR